MEKHIKPQLHDLSKLEYYHSLAIEEVKVLDELQLAVMTQDPILQAKALRALKRLAFDYFAEKYLDFQGKSPLGKNTYSINYSYFNDYQKGNDFSYLEEYKKIREQPPIEISGCLR